MPGCRGGAVVGGSRGETLEIASVPPTSNTNSDQPFSLFFAFVCFGLIAWGSVSTLEGKVIKRTPFYSKADHKG